MERTQGPCEKGNKGLQSYRAYGSVLSMGHLVKPITIDYDKAVEAATMGRSLKEIAAIAGGDYPMLCRAVENNAVFAQAIDKARKLGWFLQADRLCTLVEDNPEMPIERLALISSNIKWLLARLMRQVFGDSVEITHVRTDVRGALTEARSRTILVKRIQDEAREEVEAEGMAEFLEG